MLSKLFHKKIRAARPDIPTDRSKWPDAWKIPEYKTYPRFKQIPLPLECCTLGSLEQSLTLRHSNRDFKTDLQLTTREIGTILRYAAGCNTHTFKHSDTPTLENRRFYPSGGGRYPLEIYVVARTATETIPCGVYHYAQKTHTLENIPWLSVTTVLDAGLISNFSKHAPLIFIITAAQSRNAIKYADFGYDMLLAEAGHMSQNIHLVAESLGAIYCPFFGFDAEKIRTTLDLDTDELVLYMTAAGRKTKS